MNTYLAAGVAFVCSSSLVAQTVPPAPHAGSAIASSAQQRLAAWLPGEVRCGGEAVAAVIWRRPYLALAYGEPKPAAVTYRFRLDESGRPLSIARDVPGYTPFGDDIGPSLAASRFRVTGERGDCAVTYTARVTALADTPTEDLISYSLTPTNGALSREGWAAIYPAAATCDDEPRPAPLSQVFPDFAKVAGTPGVRDWTMFAYDLDAKGAPRNVQVLTGTANRSLGVAGGAALARSRYTGGPRTGCRYPFWKAAEIMPGPAIADRGTFQPGEAPAGCEGTWVSKPPLRYPENYRRRSIEGWAVIGFDIAPWGATGNVRALASEPAAEFGEQAAALIRDAKRAVSETGVTGCTDRVRFVMGRPGMKPDTEMVGS